MQVPQNETTGLLKEIFLEALEWTDFTERSVFLQAACGTDAELRQRVEDLLNEQESVGSFLELPVWSTTIDPGTGRSQPYPSPLPPSEEIGEYIGKYKLVKRLGEGGCGVVYVAQQEEPLRREVALKVIKLGTDTKQVISRFEAERQTLALMDHPNIAKVFDAGTTQAGRPFFVMELIRGRKLTEHCNRNRLTIHERLRLFIQVCLGVQHAHQKGVIHRDIKPSNILVANHDGLAIPKIIDFGIATAVHKPAPAAPAHGVGFRQLIGTPAYMSPEQAAMNGLDVDTRSDIYSLGIILRELLSGRDPLPGQALLDRVLDAHHGNNLEPEPMLPSNRVSALPESEVNQIAQDRRSHPAHFVKVLRGDLDCIVLKALERDPTHRYPTASAFAQDIEHYLAHKPVLARPATKLYRLRKLAQRHQAAVAALSGVAFVLLMAVGLSGWLELRTKQAETEARLSQDMEAQLRREAVRARQRAETQADLARRNEYVADINLAQESLNAGNYGRAAQLLDKHLPQPHEADLRGFEWRYLWQLSRGDDHLQFPVQNASIRALSISPGGHWLAMGTDNALKLWEVSSRTLIHIFPARVISAVFCAKDSQLVLSGPSEVRIVNLTNWAEITLPNQDGGALAISKDGSRLAVATRDGVRLWDTKTWTTHNVLPGTTAPLAFSPDDRFLATNSREGIALWGLTNVSPHVVFKNSHDVFRLRPWDQLGSVMTFSPDGRYLAAPRNFPSDHGIFVISIWDVESGAEVAALPQDPEHPEHTGTIAGLAISPDGNTLATASMDHSIRLWDLHARRLLRVLHGHLSEVWTVAFSADGATLFSGAKDGSVDIWAIPPTPKSDMLDGPYAPLAFSSDSRHLAVLDEEKGTVLFLDPATKHIDDRFQMPGRSFRSPARFALSADFKVLAEAHRNHVSLYNTVSRQRVELEIGEAPVFELTLSPDGSQLVIGAFGGTFEWWDLSTRTKKVLGSEIRRALFSPDGATLLLLVGEQRAELWDTANRALRTVLTAESRLGAAVAFSPNNHLLAIGSNPLSSEQMINVWDVGTGRLLGPCIGHKQGITGLAFTADGLTLASASSDSTLKLWNIATRQQLASFPIPGRAHRPLFSPDGTLLALGQSLPQKGIRFYPAPLTPESDPQNQSLASP